MERTNPSKANATAYPALGGLIADVLSFLLICLVLLGLAGVLYKTLGPEGWVSAVLDQLWNTHPGFVWLVGFAAASGLAAARWWLNRGSGQRSEIVAYGFMALGLFFFFKLVVTGSL